MTDTYEMTEAETIEWFRGLHEQHPAKRPCRCPECNLFSALPWEQSFGTENGTQWSWGGVCKTHGPWRESE